MTVIFRQLFKFVYLLNSERSTNSIAVGIACGLILGFSPVTSLQSLIVLISLLIFRIQFGAALTSMAFFKLISPLFEDVFHYIGDVVLSLYFLEPIFTSLYNTPLVPYTRFYNSVVLGSGFVAILLIVPTYFVSKRLIERYRETVVTRLKQSEYWKYWKTTTVYRWYIRYLSMFE